MQSVINSKFEAGREETQTLEYFKGIFQHTRVSRHETAYYNRLECMNDTHLNAVEQNRKRTNSYNL